MTTHVLNLTIPGYGEDHFRSYEGHNGVLLRMYGKHQRSVCNFHIYYVGPQGSGRRVTQGPIVQGPYASMGAMATVIAAHPIRENARVIEVAEGDHIVINGQTFEIRDDKDLYDPQLHLIPSVTVGKAQAEKLLELMKEAFDGCDHSVGICQCDAMEAIEELSAAIDGRESWWVQADRLAAQEEEAEAHAGCERCHEGDALPHEPVRLPEDA